MLGGAAVAGSLALLFGTLPIKGVAQVPPLRVKDTQIRRDGDCPAAPVVRLHPPNAGAQVPSLVGELDPAGCGAEK